MKGVIRKSYRPKRKTFIFILIFHNTGDLIELTQGSDCEIRIL